VSPPTAAFERALISSSYSAVETRRQSEVGRPRRFARGNPRTENGCEASRPLRLRQHRSPMALAAAVEVDHSDRCGPATCLAAARQLLCGSGVESRSDRLGVRVKSWSEPRTTRKVLVPTGLPRGRGARRRVALGVFDRRLF